jgi:hypothetical protein
VPPSPNIPITAHLTKTPSQSPPNHHQHPPAFPLCGHPTSAVQIAPSPRSPPPSPFPAPHLSTSPPSPKSRQSCNPVQKTRFPILTSNTFQLLQILKPIQPRVVPVTEIKLHRIPSNHPPPRHRHPRKLPRPLMPPNLPPQQIPLPHILRTRRIRPQLLHRQITLTPIAPCNRHLIPYRHNPFRFNHRPIQTPNPSPINPVKQPSLTTQILPTAPIRELRAFRGSNLPFPPSLPLCASQTLRASACPRGSSPQKRSAPKDAPFQNLYRPINASKAQPPAAHSPAD